MSQDAEFIYSQLKEANRDYYLSSLLFPEKSRFAISVLFAFDAEISRIRSLINEPLPGEIRLQWWREVAAESARKDEAAANPLAAALNQVIEEYQLNRRGFDNYCRARIFDLYDDLMPDTHTYEGYCGETKSILLQWVSQVIGGDETNTTADTSGHGGIALCISHNLVSMARDRARGQIYIPADILKKHDLDRDAFLSGQKSDNNAKAITEFVELGRHHLNEARGAVSNLTAEARQAYLLLSSCARIFKRAEKLSAECLVRSPAPLTLFTQWDLWLGYRKGMF